MNRRSFLQSVLFGAMITVTSLMGVKASEVVDRGHKIVYVYSVDDLPKPVNGVINLDENVTYDFMIGLNIGNTRMRFPKSGFTYIESKAVKFNGKL